LIATRLTPKSLSMTHSSKATPHQALVLEMVYSVMVLDFMVAMDMEGNNYAVK